MQCLRGFDELVEQLRVLLYALLELKLLLLA